MANVSKSAKVLEIVHTDSPYLIVVTYLTILNYCHYAFSFMGTLSNKRNYIK